MNTLALKAFAPAVRRQLMEAVSIKLDFALSASTPDYLDTYASQVRALRELATTDRKGLVERVAYTWFNRLAALRYLDARNWHPFHARVLMAATVEDTLPELFAMARTGAVPEELRRYVDVARMESILQGRIPSADPQGEAYRMLVLGACRFYHDLLPDVFERLDDETELLLPDDLLTQQSVAQGFRTEVTDEDCEQVEVLGWLYQFYISEKKDQVMARKAAVPAEDIPAVTQLFTPHWIVRYLVENSLGRLWLLNRPESLLKAWMPYYIESAEPETEFLRVARPQDIRLCDPAVGSGHMLTYAFDLLYVIYEEEGYAPSEIPALILRHNLTGIEIDARAAQLAALALTLKGREKSQRFFQQQHFVRPNIVELRDIHFAEGELLGYSEALGLGGLFTPPILRLMHQFEEAKNFGSLIQPCVGDADIAFARGSVEARNLGSNLFLNETHKQVLRVLEQADVLTQRYSVVVANPPYMSNMNPALTKMLIGAYEGSRSDMSASFITRGRALCVPQGLCALVTMHSWMFLGSLETFRRELMATVKITSLAHLGIGAFPTLNSKIVQAVAFIVSITPPLQRDIPICFRLLDYSSTVKEEQLLARSNQFARLTQREFLKIPGCPLAYWISEKMLTIISEGILVETIADSRKGMVTGKNEDFVRLWHEVSHRKIHFAARSRVEAQLSQKKWFPYAKGGDFRKWYGNSESVVDWSEDGRAIQTTLHPSGLRVRATNFNLGHIFKRSICWTVVTNAESSFRFYPEGYLFDAAAGLCQPNEESDELLVLGALNTKVTANALKAINPTLNLHPGYLGRIPISLEPHAAVSQVVKECIAVARADWDNFEGSWDFTDHPTLRHASRATSVEGAWLRWKSYADTAIARMQTLETENNRLFIDSFGLEDELDPCVTEQEITLARADRRRDMASLLSYMVGCVMGRYSLDNPGLILADAGDGLPAYLSKLGRAMDDLKFAPDKDGIVPVLDDEWFADDIVARTREFLKVTFGEATLRENIRFIEESLGRDIRSYFLTDYYKDHLQTYNKRPIYWMVQSPRKGFSVLIYLHRYTRDTMNVILNRYLREFQVKLRSKIEHLAAIQTSASTTVRDKTVARKESDKLTRTLHECQEWERQTILPLAQARIELDLDDGVKANYLKLGEALAPIPGLAAAED